MYKLKLDYTVDELKELKFLKHAPFHSIILVAKITALDSQFKDLHQKWLEIPAVDELKFMTEQHFGRIVNTTSGAGLVAGKGMALYSACKHAILGLTKAAALDYAKKEITINAVAPGTIATELILPYKETAPEEFKKWEDSNPIGRLGKPAEIGHAVKFFFEDGSEFVNGVILPVDSGCVAGNF